MRKALVALLAAIVLVAPAIAQEPGPMTGRDPIEIAKVLAARYPEQQLMSYIPALSWSGQLRLSALTGDSKWRERALEAMRPFVNGETPTIAEPYRLTSLAGALALFDVRRAEDGRALDAAATGVAHAYQVAAERVAYFIQPGAAGIDVKYQTGWTDDMFMAGSVLARHGTPDAAQLLRKLLKAHAAKLQRADGLFIHAPNGPHAWGRGNGFALLGVTEALTHLPEAWPGMNEPWATRAEVLDIYRRHVAALAKHQSDDGSWRQVIDEPGSYRELTVTAMTVAAVGSIVRPTSRSCSVDGMPSRRASTVTAP